MDLHSNHMGTLWAHGAANYIADYAANYVYNNAARWQSMLSALRHGDALNSESKSEHIAEQAVGGHPYKQPVSVVHHPLGPRCGDAGVVALECALGAEVPAHSAPAGMAACMGALASASGCAV